MLSFIEGRREIGVLFRELNLSIFDTRMDEEFTVQ